MKSIFKTLLNLFARIRYPLSMPEEIAADLGLNLSNSLSFQELMWCLTDPSYKPTKLTRFMSREQAENNFRSALKKERFFQDSLFSYHFNGGWMEFMLHFDEHARLRRLYIRHKDLEKQHEIPIS